MKYLFFLPCLAMMINAHSQVSITNNGSSPDNSAMLDIVTTVKGLLLPRMTQVQRNAIASPATGLMIYQTDNSPGFYYNSGTSVSPIWIMAGSSGSWNITGNSGTNAGINFIGTTDPQPLLFKVNNEVAGKMDYSNPYNTSFGFQSLNSNTGLYNSAFGYQGLLSNTLGYNNTASGYNSIYSNTTGYNNTATGFMALYSNTTGYNNTANGYRALYSNITGGYNIANGVNALFSNTEGWYNTANGVFALTDNTTGSSNTANGALALRDNTTGYYNTADGVGSLVLNTTGYHNTAAGYNSLYSNTTGYYNTAIGTGALAGNNDNNNTAVGYNASGVNTSGFQNTSLGANSLVNNTTGAYHTAVGYNTGPNSTSYVNTTCLGIDATATGSDMVRIGNIYVGSIGGYQNWTNLSDGRYKQNVKEDVPGLSFLMNLRPVTYTLDVERINQSLGMKEGEIHSSAAGSEASAMVHSGFIAQEVEHAAGLIGYNFSGVDTPKNDSDMYGLRYAEFVVPLVKAVQEQQNMLEAQQLAIEALKVQNELLWQIIEKLGNKK